MGEGRPKALAFTVDASVCARWLIPGEEHEAKALKIRDDYAEGTIELCSPHLLFFEVLNAVWKAAERKLASIEDAVILCGEFEKIVPKAVNLNGEDAEKTMKIATESHITFYDASYITAASKTNSTLITADNQLYNTAKNYVDALRLRDY